MIALKAQNPSLKCIAAVGGYNPDLESAWYKMAESSVTRSNFARNILAFLSSHKLDGIGE
jgi:GH18 family chitinase